MVFSDSSGGLGIVEQTRSFARVDSTQWPVKNVVNSVNNWLDRIVGYAIGADKRFQWDDTNHTALPEGTTALTINQSDYSFLTDQQGNRILNLTGVSILQNGYYVPLMPVDRKDIDVSTFGFVAGTPSQYDKIADNIIRLDYLPSATVASGLKFYFQRAPSYYTASDTTKEPGVAPELHRGFVIASAYDCALTLGLQNLQPLSVELAKEETKMQEAFSNRNTDSEGVLSTESVDFR